MAQRILQKRSSIQGRRPTPSYLEPGELAINTNGSDPGLFFEGNDGSIIKAGPTAMGNAAPTSEVPYGHGEAWFNTQSKQLNFYNATFDEWQTTLSPMYGGSEYLVFVGSNFPEADDSIGNDGSAAPFATFNRAVLEIAKRSIFQGRSDNPTQSKFAIVLLPGENVARNDPGATLDDFLSQYTPFTANQEIGSNDLKIFNPVEGGVVLPRGTSIVGFTPLKAQIHPTYAPVWTQALYEDADATLAPSTAIFHTSGGSLIERVSFTDKIQSIPIINITGTNGEVGVLHTLNPHGLQSLTLNDAGDEVISGDLVTLDYPDGVSQLNNGVESVAEGLYWAEALTETSLRIRRTADLSVVTRQELPSAPSPGSFPHDYCTFTLQPNTHHRLSAVKFASEQVLSDFYTKVQYAFGDIFFGGAVDNAEVTSAEVNIGGVFTTAPTPSVDSTYIHPVTLNECTITSNFGLGGIDADGSLTSGLKQINSSRITYTAFNNDAEVYEVYFNQQWVPLKSAAASGLGVLETAVTNEIALQYAIDSVQLKDLKYYHRPLMGVGGDAAVSSGLTDPDSDTRHFAVRADNSSLVKATEHNSVGAAIGYWARGGGKIYLDSSAISLGKESIKADGFSGINTVGGATDDQKGFEFFGIRRPSVVPAQELTNEDNIKRIHISTNISFVSATQIDFTGPVKVENLLPYTLRPGSVIWVTNVTNGNTFSATIAAGGFNAFNTSLSVEAAGNTINGQNVDDLSLPFIRRFVDPRDTSQRSYYIEVRNSDPAHTPPTTGDVLRYAEDQGGAFVQSLEAGRQLDPGESGGWNHVFKVHQSLSFTGGYDLNTLYDFDDVPEKGESYFISLILGDSVGPYLAAEAYGRGSSVTLGNRTYEAVKTDVEDGLSITPSDAASAYALSDIGTYLQVVGEAYVPTGFANVVDPNAGSYAATDVYARGTQAPDDRYDEKAVIDYDDGSANLGLVDANNSSLVNQALIDPEWSNSRLAVARFMALLGYNTATINATLEPQLWPDRDIHIPSFPNLDGGGYALSVSQWPLEFNSPSEVRGTNLNWYRPGFHNYSKGLERYQSSTLSGQLRLDAMRCSSFGGFVTVDGENDLGETLPVPNLNNTRQLTSIY